MQDKSKLVFLFVLLVIFLLFLSSCSSKIKTSVSRDQARTVALYRNATVVKDEAQRTNLSICPGELKNTICANKGIGCIREAIATEPTDCKEPPTLKCICPEQSVCVSFWVGQGLGGQGRFAWGCWNASEIGKYRTYKS